MRFYDVFLNALCTEVVSQDEYQPADVLAKLLGIDGTGSGLDADMLDGEHAVSFESVGTADAAVAVHEAASDPHMQYETQARADARYQPLDADLTALAVLSDTGGYAKRISADTWTISMPSADDVGAVAKDSSYFVPISGNVELSGNFSLGINLDWSVSRFKVFDTDSVFEIITPLAISSVSGRSFCISTDNHDFWSTLIIYSNGTIGVGGGASNRDVFIGRSSASTFSIGSNFSLSNPANLIITGYLATQVSSVMLGNGLNSNISIESSFVRIVGPSGSFSIGGFISSSDGQNLIVYNTTSNAMTIVDQDTVSDAVNRIVTLRSSNVVLAARTSSASFIYDGIISRWVLVATN